MAMPARRVLRLTPWSLLRAVAMLGVTVAVLAVLGASTRVIGWLLAATVLAGLFHPLVQALDAHVPRGVALAGVVVGAIAIVGGVAYEVVNEITVQARELQRAVPEAARELERSERFGKTARDLDLARHAREFVKELPERLRGGDVRTALQSAATRGVAFLATTVLTIFFLVYGPGLLRSATAQLPERRRRLVARVGPAAYRRAWTYVAGTLAMAAGAGLLAFACASILDLPGRAPLALWIALFSVIPLIGVVLGSVPLLLLAGTTATWPATLAVVAILVGWQVFEGLVLQRRVEERSLHLGPFVTVAVAMVGLELYGIGGVFVGLVGVIFLAAVLDEWLGHGPHSSEPVATGEPDARRGRPSPGSGH